MFYDTLEIDFSAKRRLEGLDRLGSNKGIYMYIYVFYDTLEIDFSFKKRAEGLDSPYV
jgi:hypothetical protein